MSMKRLRNVAVRMRPPNPADDTQPDLALERAAPSIPVRAAKSAPEGAPKRQIWDLEANGAEAPPAAPSLVQKTPAQSGPLVLRKADLAPPSRAQVVPNAAPETSAGSAPPRAKTRIIGFHAEDFADDAPGEIDSGPVFPAGFLVVIDGPGRGAHFTVSTRVSCIGRGEDQDVSLDFGDESISRSGHASVMYDAEQNSFFLGHGNKANAVRRNDMPVLATEKLDHGDDIRIGKTTLRFHAFCGPDFTWDDADDS